MSKIINDVLDKATKIAIVSHINPDADALCSSLALKNIIKNNYDYKYVDVFVDGEIGSLYDPILRDEVVNPRKPCSSYDLVFVLDSPNIERTGIYGDLILNTPVIVDIDHHATNEKFGTYNFVSAGASSTCEMIYLMAKGSKFEMNNLIAKELYQGIITDTNCFTSNAISRRSHQVISELLGYKFDSEAIKAYYFKNNSVAKTRLLQKALISLKFYGGEKFTTMKIPNELFAKFDASFEDSLGIIDNGINISGTEISAILVEKEPERIHVSLRSKGKINVGEIAQKFGGGGSLELAAYQTEGNIKECESALVAEVLPQLGDIKEDEEILF